MALGSCHEMHTRWQHHAMGCRAKFAVLNSPVSTGVSAVRPSALYIIHQSRTTTVCVGVGDMHVYPLNFIGVGLFCKLTTRLSLLYSHDNLASVTKI